MKKLIGPFTQILTLAGLPVKGAISDDRLQIMSNGGALVEDGFIVEVNDFSRLKAAHPEVISEEIEGDHVLLPGFVDCHTHLCFAGDRAKDYALRISGKTYLDIAKAGGGIWDTVAQTRQANLESLTASLLQRINSHAHDGITTLEIKTGYGLTNMDELKQLHAIQLASDSTPVDLISTCLAGHLLPRDFKGSATEYLNQVATELLPVIKKHSLASRVDIFIEESAFNPQDAAQYLNEARQLGFDITVHADQFTTGGSRVAVEAGAVSADHLEASRHEEIALIAASDTVAVALPGASLGLGMPFAPARKLLDKGACLAIASDWNPGSAPMGDLLMQASVLSAYEKLTTAETFAGLTFRAAAALKLFDRGSLENNKLADMQAYPCKDYCDILYYQGKLKPARVWKKGVRI